MFKLPKLNQAGAMSMLTVIFLALLLTIITTSFVRLSVTEQRQAIDDDLTTRAFYAAESGVEDAKRAITAYLDGAPASQLETSPPSCSPASTGGTATQTPVVSSDLQAEYTCQLIDLSPANFEQELSAWQGVTIPLRSTSSFDRVRIDWHYRAQGDPPVSTRNSKQLPAVGAWGNNTPAMLRLASFWLPATVDNQRVIFANPATPVDPNNTLNNNHEVRNATCNSSAAEGSYACSITITGFGANTYYLRLQSLYKGTNVQVTLLDGPGNNTAPLDDVQAVVDVTARAGDVYRRVEARIALQPDNYPLPDIGLWSNTEICKDFTITDVAAGYLNSCPWQP